MFAYDEELAEIIRETGSTAHLRGQPVYCDEILMDFDNHRPEAFLAWLRSTDLAYEILDSGGRSVHVHVPLTPIFGSWVPAAVKSWTKKHAPTADISFLHPAGVYRLTGTYHASNAGRRKELVECRMGEPLTLAQEPRRPMVLEPTGGVAELFLLLTERKGEGHRSGHLWKICTVGAEAGLSFEETLEHARWWNSRYSDPPHGDDKLQKQCESAYKRLEGRTSG